MSKNILICTDLDQTLIPNGKADESPLAGLRFSKLVERPEITLAYVSGRHYAHILEAIQHYKLPWPQYIIADVGSTIYTLSEDATDEAPQTWKVWTQNISPDWAGYSPHEIHALFSDLSALRLQESAKQSDFKLSYDTAPKTDHVPLLKIIQTRLSEHGIHTRLIWSVEESTQAGLLDILPAQAGKYHAIAFMMRYLRFSIENTIFSGDSGNDMEVLSSPIQAILVTNSSTKVQQQALQHAKQAGNSEKLYIAKGGFMGMNGNYGGGVLEGIAHYLPQTKSWMRLEKSDGL